jgi:hypothetical protein
MCGPSSQEKNISSQQGDFYSTLQSHYGSEFAPFQSILGGLTKNMTPILNAGPSQKGFSPAQENDMNTQATENTAGEYGKAQTATQDILSARGGGDSYLPSGVDATLTAQNANAAAGSLATQKSNILQANYNQGYGNWKDAATYLGGVASQYNPNGAAGVATSAGNDAFNSASKITSETEAPYNALIGGLSSVGAQAASHAW